MRESVMASDYKKKFSDITQYLPVRYRTPVNTALLGNLHNKFLTKEESVPLLGMIGDKVINDNSSYITAADMERSINPLVPVAYTKLGSEEFTFTFKDTLQKLEVLGVNTTDLKTWGKAKSFNFAPPVDLDKFSNYSRYRWYGHLLNISKPYNTHMQPEYYVVSRGGISDWSVNNYWVHEEEANTFFATQGYTFNINSTIQALRPIVEYSVEMEQEMIIHLDNGIPSSTGNVINQIAVNYKSEFNQKPLFNLYLSDGSHANLVSSIFYYAEGNNFPVDNSMRQRIATDIFGDFTFEQGLISNNYILFYKKAGVLKSIWAAGEEIVPKYVTKDSNGIITEIDPHTDILKIGAWETPAQIFFNPSHENRKQIGYGDLLGHFTDIISKQDGFIGNPYGANNYRTLTNIDLGKGGRIKDFNTNFSLFFGLINQPDNSVLSIIEFGKQQYKQMLSSIDEFVTRTLPSYINEGISDSLPTVNSNTIDPRMNKLYDKFVKFTSVRNDSTVFNDTTSGFPGLVATLPILGLVTPKQPKIYFEKRLGILVHRHHDGHLTPVSDIGIDMLKGIAHMPFLRSSGVTTPGVSGFLAPSRPYKNQFWFDANINKLKSFMVKSDTVANSTNTDGDLWYERTTDILRRFDINTSSFVQIPKDTAWQIVDIDVITSQLTLMIENTLYNSVPFNNTKTVVEDILASDLIKTDKNLEYEFAKYAGLHSLDVATTDYQPSDAFTWNYKSAGQIVDVVIGTSRWYNIYEQYFGTSRPNFEPWILQGHSTKPLWWDATYADQTGTRLWTTQMWTDIKTTWNKQLCVDVQTDEILPPYVSASDPRSIEALISFIPPNIADSYVFKEDGPAELAWRLSLDFGYDLLKAAFKISPIEFINNTWGYNNVFVAGDFEMDRLAHKKLSHKEFILHGEPTVAKRKFSIDNISIDTALPDTKWTLTCIGNTPFGNSFSVTGDVSGVVSKTLVANSQHICVGLICTVRDYSTDFNIGDKLIINVATRIVEYVKAPYTKFNGLNQWFVNLNRYNSVDMTVALSNNILREWDMKLGYRVGGLINTEILDISTDQYQLHKKDYSAIIKKNPATNDHWLNSLRIQLLRVGDSEWRDGVRVPRNKGADWVFRIETFNPNHPVLEYYEYKADGKYKTFFSFEKSNSKDEWRHLVEVDKLVLKTTPMTVTGIENVANIIFGYVQFLDEEGWRFNAGEQQEIDDLTGRSINWQMFIEKFINQQYLGVESGSGIILNPFTRNVWFETKTGAVGDMRPKSFGDVMTSQTIFDSFGASIPMHQLQIIRSDQMTSFESNVIIGGIHTLIDEYEHLVLFENYTYDLSRRKLVYDPFLGVRVNRMHISTERQLEINGRLSFGGHYIAENKVKRNIEASVSDISNYYDADKMVDQSQTARYARALLGYDSKQYMSDIKMSDKTQFGFWRGMIHNKGSNASIDAFLNSSRFKSANIDEFWAYKVGTYGDARKLAYPEIKINPIDASHNSMKLQFTNTPSSADPSFTAITSTDESRWVDSNDFDGEMAFVAEVIAEIPFERIYANTLYNLKRRGGQLVIADTVEVYEWVSLRNVNGDMSPFLIQVSNFELVNSTTIKFFDVPLDYTIYMEPMGNPSFIGRKFVVKCLAPSQQKFNPAKLIDYKNKVIISDVILWDPARGAHVPEALEVVDMISPKNPAKYNYSLIVGVPEYEPLRPWSEKDVGRTWWNTKNLSYIPYSDNTIFPSLDTRLSYWGSTADWSNIELNEWVESSVHPSKYIDLVKLEEGNADIEPTTRASGTVSNKDLYIRYREWQQRPIAWGYTNVPGTVVPYVEAIGEYSVTLSLDSNGDDIAILSNGDWTTVFNDLELGMKLSGGYFHYDPTNTADADNFKLTKPFGEAIVTGLNTALVIGSDNSLSAGFFDPPTYPYDSNLSYIVSNAAFIQTVSDNITIISATNSSNLIHIESVALVSGSLPNGLTLVIDGAGIASTVGLSGSIANAGTFNLVVGVTDTLGITTNLNVQIAVTALAALNYATQPPTIVVSTLFDSTIITASNASALVHIQSVTGSSMPPGMSLALFGTGQATVIKLQGTPSIISTTSLIATVVDNLGRSTNITIPVNVIATPINTVSVSPSSITVSGVVSTETQQRSISITNTGNIDQNILVSVNNVAGLTTTVLGLSGGSSFILPVGSVRSISVSYNSAAIGTYNSIITVTTNSGITTVPVSVNIASPSLSMTEINNIATGFSYTILGIGGVFAANSLLQAPSAITNMVVTSGSLPTGMTLTAGSGGDNVLGYLTGTPTAGGNFTGTVSVTTASHGTLSGTFNTNAIETIPHGSVTFATAGNHDFIVPIGVTQVTVGMTGADGGGGIGVERDGIFYPGQDGFAGETRTVVVNLPFQQYSHTIGVNVGGAAPGITAALYQYGNGPAGSTYYGNGADGSNGGAGAGGYTHFYSIYSNAVEIQVAGGHGGIGGFNGFITGIGGDGYTGAGPGTGTGGTQASPDGKTGRDGSVTFTW